MRSNDMQWDFWTLSPESAHQVTILMSDRGTPRTYRHMNGYGSHTFSWINAAGEKFWIKYHFKTAQGIENYTEDEAVQMASEDPDAHRRDLRAAIDEGEAPEWRLEVQVMPFEDAADYRFNPFDLTKVWPHGDYPPIQVGRMVLDRNPEHFFAEVEQAGFSPSNLVPGIGLSPDKMLMGRVFSYHDTHLHRIGANYEQLPINSPKSEVNSYNQDGPMTYHHSGDQPVYAPNSHGGPAGRPREGRRPHLVGRGRGDRPLRQRQARRGRRLRPGGDALPRGDGRRRPRRAGREHRRPRQRRGQLGGPGPGGRVLDQRRRRTRPAGRRRPQGAAARRATPPQAEVPSSV